MIRETTTKNTTLCTAAAAKDVAQFSWSCICKNGPQFCEGGKVNKTPGLNTKNNNARIKEHKRNIYYNIFIFYFLFFLILIFDFHIRNRNFEF